MLCQLLYHRLSQQYRSRPSLRTLPVLLALIGSAPAVNAIGLGSPLQNPVVGQPLRIEIPLLLGPGESIPGPDCVRLSPPADAPDRQFFPRRARAVINAAGKPRISIVSPDPVAEPLLEFRLSVGCGSTFARDFLVLSDVPTAIQATPTTSRAPPSSGATSAMPTIEAPAVAAHGAPTRSHSSPRISSPPPPLDATDSHPSQTLRLTQDTNLNTLARGRYPDSQATRDEYRRLMAAANPGLFAGASRVGSVPLPAGTVLVIPPNLPPPEREASTSDPKPPAASPKPPAPAVDGAMPRQAAENRKRQDRLVIGGDAKSGVPSASAMSPRELSSAIERMERMIEDQGRTEVEITENLKTLNSAFIELKNYIQTLEAKIQQEENARRVLELKADTRPEPTKALGILELLALIVVGGAAGAGLIVLHHRLTMQRLTLNRLSENATALSDVVDTSIPEPEPARDFAGERTTMTPPPAVHTTPPAPPPPVTAPPPIAVPPAPTFTAPPTSKLVTAPVPVAVAVPPPPAPVPAPLPPPMTPLAAVLDTPQQHNPMLEFPLEFELDLPTPTKAEPLVVAEASPVSIHTDKPSTAFPPVFFAPPANTELSAGNEAIELAEIMVSMGLGKEAARNLVQHILAEPKQDLAPWLKAFDIYRETGQREEFEWLAENLRRHLNVQPQGWDDPYHGDTRSLVDFRHLTKRLVALWPTPECATFLEDLLLDNREGVRQGFPLTVAEEIVFLQKILRIRA